MTTGLLQGIGALLGSPAAGWIAVVLLTGFVIYGLISGRVFTLNQVTQLVDQANRRADDWHSVADKQSDAFDKLQGTVVELKEVGVAANKLINAINEVEKTEIP